VHVVDKNVNTAPGVLVWHSAPSYNIKHRGIFLEGCEAANLPRRFRSVWNLELLRHRLIVEGVTRCVASLGHCFPGRELLDQLLVDIPDPTFCTRNCVDLLGQCENLSRCATSF